MFQLIVAVIAIALVIALTLASIFYGGEAFTRSSLKANVAAVVNQAQQISGAHTLYRTDHGDQDASALSDLTAGGYLAQVPVGPSITTGAWSLDFTAGAERVYINLAGSQNDVIKTCDAVATNGAGTCSTTTSQFSFPL